VLNEGWVEKILVAFLIPSICFASQNNFLCTHAVINKFHFAAFTPYLFSIAVCK
jgi:hypothetical protein